MECKELNERIPAIAAGETAASEHRELMAHVENCAECRAALRGAEALVEIRRRPTGLAHADVVDTLLAVAASRSARRTDRFWLGTAVGGAVAASLFAAVLWFGDGRMNAVVDPVAGPDLDREFVVAVGEPRAMHVAIETDRALTDATIRIIVTGDIEIDGLDGQRIVSWNEDLDAGLNRLTLPVFATSASGGELVVQLEHPYSRREFVVALSTEG